MTNLEKRKELARSIYNELLKDEEIKRRRWENMKKIKIMKLTPDEGIKEIEIENTLEALQNEVEGYIEFIRIDEKHALIVNPVNIIEEGKIRKLPICLVLKKNGKIIDELVGNVLFVRIKNENVDSLTAGEVEALKENVLLNMFRCFDID